ncbi:(E,E)-geranyllinalool synthase [Trema orientale]|uniref:(E,E)-geranyllinalool synthase n=1 Tax=Trema orientale TaxID=63057 RepID=A0A2P5G0T2_TREOI|nr:(E,E)-geranyllinalool synthase [Trema orientale]
MDKFQSLSTTQATLIKTIKETVFSSIDIDPYSIVSPSAYETAWLAMIPDPKQPLKPMFDGCLSWVLNNQNEQGFWGDCDGCGTPTLDCLAASLACVVALKRWNVGAAMINKGLVFLHSSNAEKSLKEVKDHDGCPRWFAIVFPGMVELAQEVLEIELKDQVEVSNIFLLRQQILETERLVETKGHHPPLLSYLEALPSSYNLDEEDIIKNLCDDGSLFQSPSATARAFMATGNTNCLCYLQSLVQRFSNYDLNIGVPTTYPMDEELIKLCIINHVQRLGLADYFTLEIEQILEQVYKNYMKIHGKSSPKPGYPAGALLQLQLLKDSLAFRLLRMHGYKIFPWSVCWFLDNEEIRDYVENNYEYFSILLFNINRATDLAFSGEFELQEAKTFSTKLLEKSILVGARGRNPFRRLIKHELSLPWMARLDHLEHRIWIEGNETNAFWRGKTSFQRLLSLHNDKLVHLAMLNYNFKQSIFRTELEQLKRWSKDWGLSNMGFGREKTTYCYFAVAASCSLPSDSDVRMIVAKSAIVITVTDDFFDMKGSLSELRSLTEAVRRWDARGLCGDTRIIFYALDNLWYETFLSWLAESEWSRSGTVPSMDEYLQVGMISIATHTLVLPASCFLKPSLTNLKLRPTQYESVTKLVMIIARLLNDIQSYQKEKDDGKLNSVLLCLRNDPEVDMEEAIAYMREILKKKKEELLEHVLIDGFTDLPKECRLLHLSCLKVFQMFFNSSNRFDSNTELLDDIAKAIYVPLDSGGSLKTPGSLAKPPLDPPPHPESTVAKCSAIKQHYGRPSKRFVGSRFPMNQLSPPTYWRVGNWRTTMTMPPKLNFSFI